MASDGGQRKPNNANKNIIYNVWNINEIGNIGFRAIYIVTF